MSRHCRKWMSKECKSFLFLFDIILKQYWDTYIAVAINLELRTPGFEIWTLNKQNFWFWAIWKTTLLLHLCAIVFELSTLEETIVSIQQLPLCLPLIIFCFIILRWGSYRNVNSSFDGVFYKYIMWRMFWYMS